MKRFIAISVFLFHAILFVSAQTGRKPAKAEKADSSEMSSIKTDVTYVLKYQQPHFTKNSAGFNPLIIIDGYISNDGYMGLSPSDIQSVSVLKGNKAEILYGEKGKNGVILVTTMKKSPGKLNYFK